MAPIGVQELHRCAGRRLVVRDQAVGADSTVALTQGNGEGGAIRHGANILLPDEKEIVAERVGLYDLQRTGGHFLQNASRCQPNRRTSARGIALNVPTKNVLNTVPFQPLCRRDFTGNRSSTIRMSRNPASRARNSPALYLRRTGASSCSSGTFINFDNALSQEIRLYTWNTACPPGFNTRRHSFTRLCGSLVY